MISESDHRAVTLVDDAGAALDLAQTTEDALIRIDSIAVRLRRVGRLRQRIADRRIHLPAATMNEIRLQTVIVCLAQIHDHIDLPDAAIDREHWPGRIGRGDRSSRSAGLGY